MVKPQHSTYTTLTELSAPAQVLVARMHELQYGRFENLRICNGEPTFDPPPRLIRVSRFGSSEERDVSESNDWVLKAPIRDLFTKFAQLRNGIVDRLEFRSGLPCLIETTVQASECDQSVRTVDGARKLTGLRPVSRRATHAEPDGRALRVVGSESIGLGGDCPEPPFDCRLSVLGKRF